MLPYYEAAYEEPIMNFTLLFTLLQGLLSKHAKPIILGILLIGFGVASYFYVTNLQDRLTVAEKSAADWKDRYEHFELNLRTVDDKTKTSLEELKKIGDDQIDLLCEARKISLDLPQTLPSDKQIGDGPVLAVIQKKLDADKIIKMKPAAPVEQPKALDQPETPSAAPLPDKLNTTLASNVLGAATINNGWKAYCSVTNNRDETCKPFR